MAGAKEIRTKIASVSSTQKITSAMEKVATSKMRKAQLAMVRGKPYAERIRSVVGHIANAAPEYKHLYLQEREIKRVGYVVISSDRGLCGGLNTNLFKQVVRAMKEWDDKGVEVDLCVIGTKAASFFGSLGGRIVAALKQIGDAPAAADLIGGVKVMLDSYGDQRIDRLFIASNDFVNTMTQRPTVVENIACEQAARMVAMKNATENAGELISELKLVYNKARQAAITQELAEIVSGAAAIS